MKCGRELCFGVPSKVRPGYVKDTYYKAIKEDWEQQSMMHVGLLPTMPKERLSTSNTTEKEPVPPIPTKELGVNNQIEQTNIGNNHLITQNLTLK